MAELKGKNNSDRDPRRGAEEAWTRNMGARKPPIFILVERGRREDHVPSSDVEAETALKVIGRRVSEGSSVYTDCFKAYLSLSEAGYTGSWWSTT